MAQSMPSFLSHSTHEKNDSMKNTQKRTGTKGQESRQSILYVARSIILECGIEKLSHANIADRLSLSKSAVHWHFPTKESLLQALVQEYVGHLESEEARHEKKYIEAGLTEEKAILPGMRDWYRDFEHNEQGWIGIGAALIGLGHQDTSLTEPIRTWYKALYARLALLPIDQTDIFLGMMAFDGCFNIQKMGLSVLSKEEIDAIQTRILEQAFRSKPALLARIQALQTTK